MPRSLAWSLLILPELPPVSSSRPGLTLHTRWSLRWCPTFPFARREQSIASLKSDQDVWLIAFALLGMFTLELGWRWCFREKPLICLLSCGFDIGVLMPLPLYREILRARRVSVILTSSISILISKYQVVSSHLRKIHKNGTFRPLKRCSATILISISFNPLYLLNCHTWASEPHCHTRNHSTPRGCYRWVQKVAAPKVMWWVWNRRCLSRSRSVSK